jgi:hypothetical protein
MADGTYYAWSPIRIADKDANLSTINVGEEVSEGDLGDYWDTAVAEGVVRNIRYPDTGRDETPMTALIRQARETLEAVQRGEQVSNEDVNLAATRINAGVGTDGPKKTTPADTPDDAKSTVNK